MHLWSLPLRDMHPVALAILAFVAHKPIARVRAGCDAANGTGCSSFKLHEVLFLVLVKISKLEVGFAKAPFLRCLVRSRDARRLLGSSQSFGHAFVSFEQGCIHASLRISDRVGNGNSDERREGLVLSSRGKRAVGS